MSCWRWPEDKLRGIVPWYVMLWRALFILPLYAGLLLAAASIAGGYGLRRGVQFWTDHT